ncbi:MAG: hypothetical protein AAGG68_22455 [Bacteroidota bacterium]
MQAIEFSGIIKEGKIAIPQQYKSLEQQTAKVILLVETSPLSQKERLANLFHKMKSVEMFADIKNPIQWQKELRDEWE